MKTTDGSYRHYFGTIQLPLGLTLATVGAIITTLQGHGEATVKGISHIDIHFWADDEWDLRELLGDIENELASEGIDWTPDKTDMTA